MIEPRPKVHGQQPAVIASCDGDCDCQPWTVNCDYERVSTGNFNPKIGQVNKKLTGMGWSIVKKKLYCPACTEDRKGKTMTTPADTPPREPSRVQKREIMEYLDSCYDTENERYIAGDTDDTVADALNVMPGWVAQLREEFFGPDGGNEDMSATLERLEALEEQFTTDRAHAQALVDRMTQGIEEVRELRENLTKIKKAVGPRKLSVASVS